MDVSEVGEWNSGMLGQVYGNNCRHNSGSCLRWLPKRYAQRSDVSVHVQIGTRHHRNDELIAGHLVQQRNTDHNGRFVLPVVRTIIHIGIEVDSVPRYRRMEIEKGDNMKLTNKQYDILKWVALVVIPASATLVLTVGKIWGLPYYDNIGATISAIGLFLAAIIGVSSSTYTEEMTEAEANETIEEFELGEDEDGEI